MDKVLIVVCLFVVAVVVCLFHFKGSYFDDQTRLLLYHFELDP